MELPTTYYGVVVEHIEEFGGETTVLESQPNASLEDAAALGERARRNRKAYSKVTLVKVTLEEVK